MYHHPINVDGSSFENNHMGKDRGIEGAIIPHPHMRSPGKCSLNKSIDSLELWQNRADMLLKPNCSKVDAMSSQFSQ